MLVRANKACSVCLGSKLDRADVMRGRLGAIRAAPTGFRYRCARGIPNRPAGPAKKLQRFETLRLLWRRDSVCSKSNTPLPLEIMVLPPSPQVICRLHDTGIIHHDDKPPKLILIPKVQGPDSPGRR